MANTRFDGDPFFLVNREGTTEGGEKYAWVDRVPKPIPQTGELTVSIEIYKLDEALLGLPVLDPDGDPDEENTDPIGIAAPERVEVALVKCDCGCEKAGGAAHSTWCKTQEAS